MAPAVYDSIIRDTRSASVDVNDVYDFELKTSLVRMTNRTSLDEGRVLISDPGIKTVLDLAGTLKPVNSVQDVISMAHETAHWYLLGRVSYSLERFKDVLSVLGVRPAIKEVSFLLLPSNPEL